MMKLSVEQKFWIQQRAGLGMTLADVLVSIGLSGDDAEDAARDPEIRQLFAEGRAEGVERIRAKLTTLGLGGNASALRVLLQNRAETAAEEEPETWRCDSMTPEQYRQATRKIEPRVRALFAYQKALQEAPGDPTEPVPEHVHELRRAWERLW